MTDQLQPSIVIDNGSWDIKAGICGDDFPRAQFINQLGRAINAQVLKGADYKDVYIGEECQKKKQLLNMTYPVKKGIITDWVNCQIKDAMETILFHCFNNELRIITEDHPILMSKPPLNPKQNNEKLIQIIFEKFHFAAFYLAQNSVLSLFASGKTTGVIVDSGYQVTHTVPIYEGYCMPHATQQINLGGWNISEYLSQLLNQETDLKITEIEIINQIKENKCFVASDFESEIKHHQEIKNKKISEYQFTLPDGSKIYLGNQIFRAPEILFSPNKIGLDESQGIHDLTYSTINKCDSDLRKDLYNNIILWFSFYFSGGNMMYKNIQERLYKEVASLAPSAVKINVVDPPESAWIGGSILANLPQFQDIWITQKEYEEHGYNIIHKKAY